MRVVKRIAYLAIYIIAGIAYFPIYLVKGINAANSFIESTLVRFQDWMD